MSRCKADHLFDSELTAQIAGEVPDFDPLQFMDGKTPVGPHLVCCTAGALALVDAGLDKRFPDRVCSHRPVM